MQVRKNPMAQMLAYLLDNVRNLNTAGVRENLLQVEVAPSATGVALTVDFTVEQPNHKFVLGANLLLYPGNMAYLFAWGHGDAKSKPVELYYEFSDRAELIKPAADKLLAMVREYINDGSIAFRSTKEWKTNDNSQDVYLKKLSTRQYDSRVQKLDKERNSVFPR